MPSEQEKSERKSKFYDEFPCCMIRKRISDELKWSLTEAAKKFKEAGIDNVTAEAVRQWTGGYSRPDMNKLKEISKVLGCSLNYLFGMDDLPKMDDNEVNRRIGLSEKAIAELEYCHRGDGKDLVPNNKIVQVINALLEDDSSILSDIGDFLFNVYLPQETKYWVQDTHEPLFVVKVQNGKDKPIFSSQLNEMHLATIQLKFQKLRARILKEATDYGEHQEN